MRSRLSLAFRIKTRFRGVRRAAAALVCLLLSALLGAESSPLVKNSIPAPPEPHARAAVVIDAATGTLLYGKNPQLDIPPASLTKLVTLHVAYEEIRSGRLSKGEMIEIDKRDCSPYVPYGSSLMYLQPGMRVSVLDLMRGAAVASGNDATFALARRISGSNELFAERMNEEMRRLGFSRLRFVEPSGLSELNAVNALDFALFCRRYMELHPEAIAELHSLRYIEFPRPEHATASYRPEGRIIQYNRNSLVDDYPGCDGLKTGYIIEAGFNLAATAVREGSRFIIVTLGGSGTSSAGGGEIRSRDGAALLDWAFTHFATSSPPIPPIAAIRTWFGAKKTIRLEPASALAVTLPRSELETLEARLILPPWVDAPVASGDRVGEVIYSSGGKVLRRVDILASDDSPKGNVFVLIRDAFLKVFAAIAGAFKNSAA